MKKLLTRLAVVVSGVALFAGVALANTAYDPFVGNDGTGYHSDNVAEMLFDSEVLVSNLNDYGVDNDVDVDLETGDNKLSGDSDGYDWNHKWRWDCHGWCGCEEDSCNGDTGMGEITSGDASATVHIANSGNTNRTIISTGDWTLPSVANMSTGACSDNEASAVITSSVKVENTNVANVDNDVDVKVSTGDNEAKYNTGSASIVTGDASANVTVENDLNSNYTEIHS